MPFFPELNRLEDDPILQIPIEFNADPRKDKANLGVGTFRSAEGTPWILPSVKEAEALLLREEKSKEYLPIQGDPLFCKALPAFLFGKEPERLACLQTVGGSGALRIFGDFVRLYRPESTIYISDPSWPNHEGIFKACGLKVASYPYYDRQTQLYKHEELIAALKSAPEGSVILLHGCCHNPTGMDPTKEQWAQIFSICNKRGHKPFLDIAYQGFGEGLHADAEPARLAAEMVPEFAVCYSCSKNMGLYGERVGQLMISFDRSDQAQNALTHLKKIVRGNYSSPPMHGAKIAALLLTVPALFEQWKGEVEQMRQRVKEIRTSFAKALKPSMNVSALEQGKGLFTLLNLTPDQVGWLKKERGIYMPKTGRVNVAGLTEHNLDLVLKALAGL